MAVSAKNLLSDMMNEQNPKPVSKRVNIYIRSVEQIPNFFDQVSFQKPELHPDDKKRDEWFSSIKWSNLTDEERFEAVLYADYDFESGVKVSMNDMGYVHIQFMKNGEGFFFVDGELNGLITIKPDGFDSIVVHSREELKAVFESVLV